MSLAMKVSLFLFYRGLLVKSTTNLFVTSMFTISLSYWKWATKAQKMNTSLKKSAHSKTPVKKGTKSWMTALPVKHATNTPVLR